MFSTSSDKSVHAHNIHVRDADKEHLQRVYTFVMLISYPPFVDGRVGSYLQRSRSRRHISSHFGKCDGDSVSGQTDPRVRTEGVLCIFEQ